MEFPKNIDLASLFFPNANLATRKKHVSIFLLQNLLARVNL